MATMANTHKADPIEAYYEILIELKEVSENNYVVIPHIPDPLQFGKTVHYTSDDGAGNYVGKVEIEFPSGSPYLHNGSELKKVTSNEPPLELKVKGNFMGRCYVWKDGVKWGWSLTDPRAVAGANHDVQ